MIGYQAGPYYYELTEDQFQKFAKATSGDQTSSGSPVLSIQNFPTFLTSFRQGEFELFEKIGLSLTEVLHAEQEYEYLADVAPGMKLAVTTEVEKEFSKEGKQGALKFFVFKTSFEDANAQTEESALMARGWTTIVVPPSTKSESSKTSDPTPGSDPQKGQEK